MRADVRILRVLVTLALLPSAAGRLDAQADHIHSAAATDPPAWSWSWDTRVFAGWNYQRRKFRDFQALESQNWIMGSGQRPLGGGRLRLTGMTSFELFTIQPLGSPQVFQTGETFQQAPLIDYQHPHELFMALGLAYERNVLRARAFVHADVVGSPALGPPAFMHRPSAAESPTAPLSHHMADATHITPGVVTAGVERGALTLAGSWFRGLEPDENRKDIDLGRLDSWSVQGTWRRKGWEAQVSGAHLTTPEWVEPFFDVTRLSASLAFTQPDGRLAVLAAWGQNREVHGILDGYLLEATARPQRRMVYYLRAEVVTKDILGAGGRHPLGFTHFHPLSKVGALTAGYVFDLSRSRAGTIGVGGDLTAYSVPGNLKDSYGRPLSFHLFLRFRPNTTSSHPLH